MITSRLSRPSRFAMALLGTIAVGYTGITMAEDEGNVRQTQHEKRMMVNEQWNALTPEQQEAAHAKASDAKAVLTPKAQAAWDNMSPEQQDAAINQAKDAGKAFRADVKAGRQSLTREEKAAIQQENRAIRQQRRVTE